METCEFNSNFQKKEQVTSEQIIDRLADNLQQYDKNL